MVFAIALEETFKVLEMFRIDCPSCLKVMMDSHFSLHLTLTIALAPLGPIRKFTLATYSDFRALSSECARVQNNWWIYLYSAIRLNPNHLNSDLFAAIQQRSWFREWQSCHQGKEWLLWRIANITYICICLILVWLLHDSMCYFIVLMSSLLLYNKEKPWNE